MDSKKESCGFEEGILWIRDRNLVDSKKESCGFEIGILCI